jgi:predicted CopG family antitoxin
MSNTTIQIDEELWNELNKRRKLGETMGDVIARIILETKEK